jgi:hypothetical protein
MLAGLLVGLVEVQLAVPAAQSVLGASTAQVAGGYLGFVTAAGPWPAVALGIPFAVLLVVSGLSRSPSPTAGTTRASVPLLELPAWRPRLPGRLAQLRVRQALQIREALNQLPLAFTVVLLLVLGIAVSRW